MQFTLSGFTDESGFRIFSFKGTAPDQRPQEYTVRADVALTRRYGIPLQELPLLCRHVLDEAGEELKTRSFTMGEDAMSLYAQNCVSAREAAALKRKPPKRRGPAPDAATPWRAWQVAPGNDH